jgi:hypothetical protein
MKNKSCIVHNCMGEIRALCAGSGVYEFFDIYDFLMDDVADHVFLGECR